MSFFSPLYEPPLSRRESRCNSHCGEGIFLKVLSISILQDSGFLGQLVVSSTLALSMVGIMVNHWGPVVTRHAELLCFAGSSWFVCYLGLVQMAGVSFHTCSYLWFALSAALEKNACNVTAQWLPHQIHLGWVSTGGTGRRWNLSSVGFCSVDTFCQPVTFSPLSNRYSFSHWHLHVLTYYSFSSV